MALKSEIFWYEDQSINQLIIGKRGGKEYKLDLHEFRMDVLRRKIDHKLTPEEVWKIAFKEDQYVYFEEIIEQPKLLQ